MGEQTDAGDPDLYNPPGKQAETKPAPVWNPVPPAVQSAGTTQPLSAPSSLPRFDDESVKRINRHLRGKIGEQLAIEFLELEGHITVAQAKNPKIPKEIFKDIIESRREVLEGFADRIAEINKIQPEGTSLDANWRMSRLQQVREQMQAEVLETVRQKHYARRGNNAEAENDIIAAWEAVRKETPLESDKSWMSSIIEPIYNKEKGGMQMGGVIGAIAGLAGGALLTGGFGDGMGMVATAILVAFGAWAGNKYMDSKKEPLPSAGIPVRVIDKSPSKGQALQVANSGVDVKKTVSGLGVDKDSMPQFMVAASGSEPVPAPQVPARPPTREGGRV